VGAVAVAVVLIAVTVRIVAANASGCAGGLPLHVVASPEIAPTIEEIGREWIATRPQVAGECIDLSVESVASPTVASSLTVFAGRSIDVAAAPEPSPSEAHLPAVWIPDSTAWLTRVQTVDSAAFEQPSASIATSPIVLAMPEAAAKAVGWPNAKLQLATLKPLLNAGGPLKLGIAEPRRETASLAATIVLSEALAATDDDLPSLVRTFRGVVKTSSTGELLRTFGERVNSGPASEQAVLEYDSTNPPLKLVSVQTDPPAPTLDYPYAIRTGISREAAQAAAKFRDAMLGGLGADRLARRAFRTPDGVQGTGFPFSTASSSAPYNGSAVDDPARVQRALGLWTAANSPSRTLALFDVTASMATPMDTAVGPGNRMTVMAAAAKSGLGLFAQDSRVGMWAFGAQRQEVLPIEELGAEQRGQFDARLSQASPSASDHSELYATLGAAYEAIKKDYDPTRPNLIVVLTDGADSDMSDNRLRLFNEQIQTLADPTRPIRVVLIGIAASPADAARLQKIADIMGGGFFPLTSPEQIQSIFLRALLRVGS
jgi:hypothetical protein